MFFTLVLNIMLNLNIEFDGTLTSNKRMFCDDMFFEFHITFVFISTSWSRANKMGELFRTRKINLRRQIHFHGSWLVFLEMDLNWEKAFILFDLIKCWLWTFSFMPFLDGLGNKVFQKLVNILTLCQRKIWVNPLRTHVFEIVLSRWRIPLKDKVQDVISSRHIDWGKQKRSPESK